MEKNLFTKNDAESAFAQAINKTLGLPDDFHLLFNKETTSANVIVQKEPFLAKSMNGLLEGGQYGLLLGDTMADANCFAAQAFNVCKNKRPLLYIGRKNDCQQFLLSLATNISGVELTNLADFEKLPPNKQLEINKVLKQVNVEPVAGDVSADEIWNLFKANLTLQGLHVFCNVSYLCLTDKYYLKAFEGRLGEKVSLTFLCNVPWILNAVTRRRKNNTEYQNTNVISTTPLDSEGRGRKTFQLGGFSKIICIRAGNVQVGRGLETCWVFAKMAKKKKQAFVVDFFDENNLWLEKTAQERKGNCWFSRSKALFTDSKPSGQTYLPDFWAGIA